MNLLSSLLHGGGLCLSCAPVGGSSLKASKWSQMSKNTKRETVLVNALFTTLVVFEVQLLTIKQSCFYLVLVAFCLFVLEEGFCMSFSFFGGISCIRNGDTVINNKPSNLAFVT